MDYSEAYRSQLHHGPLLRTPSGAVGSDDPRLVHHLVHASRGRAPQVAAFHMLTEGAAFDAYRAAMPVSEKLKILGGHDCDVYEDADTHRWGMEFDPADDFASDSPVRKLGRLVLWHCECLYYQMVGQWLGQRGGSMKQKWTGVADRRCSTAH